LAEALALKKSQAEALANIARKKQQLAADRIRTKELIKKEERVLATLPPYEFVTYVPFAEHFNTPENRARGLRYLSDSMHATYQSTYGKKIATTPSAIRSLPIERAIPYKFPMVLNIIERMDFQQYYEPDGKTLKSQKSIESLMEYQAGKALTTFGMNLDEAFSLQKSKVGALGIGQIMPTTYRRFQSHPKYQPFFPETDFPLAAKNHSTSFRLQVAHFDDQIFQFPREIQDNWNSLLEDRDTRIGLLSLLAAGYNGSMKRIIEEVFPASANISGVEQYRKRLAPAAIRAAMEFARDRRIAPLEEKLKKNAIAIAAAPKK
jgi:hypothetical protein